MSVRICLLLIVAAALAACGDGGPAPKTDEAVAKAEPELKADAGRKGGQTLARVKRRGVLLCGVHPGLAGFSRQDNRGRWRGFDVDFCRATAAAVLGDAEKVRFVPLDPGERFDALRRGRVDVLWRNTSATFTRDVRDGLEFPGVNYYDGQGFLVPRALALASAAELAGARVCMQANSTSRLNAEDWFRTRGVRYEPVVLDDEAAARLAYGREQCDALTGDVSTLAAARSVMNNPADHVLLPEVISKEPLGPVVRQDDARWADIVRWVLNTTVLAEELGASRRNVEALATETADPGLRRLLGVEPGYGSALGLDDRWALRVVAQVGNYGEIFDRNIGRGSPLGLERGLNALWNADRPGLMYALPLR